MRIGLAFTHPSLSYLDRLFTENCSPDKFVLHFQRRINILRIEKGKLSGQGSKGVNVRPIRIEFTRIGVVSGYVRTGPKTA